MMVYKGDRSIKAIDNLSRNDHTVQYFAKPIISTPEQLLNLEVGGFHGRGDSD